MKEHFKSQIDNLINTKQTDPLMFYIVGGKVEHCSLSAVDSLEHNFTFIENRTISTGRILGPLNLPVLERK